MKPFCSDDNLENHITVGTNAATGGGFRKTQLVALFIVVSFLGWRGFLSLKNQQAARLLDLAESFEEQDQRNDAVLSLQTARRLSPNSSEVLARLGLMSAKIDLHPMAMESYQDLRKIRELNFKEWRNVVLQMARLSQPLSLRRAKNQLVLRSEAPLLKHLLEADISSQIGDLDAAYKDLLLAMKPDSGTGPPLLVQSHLLGYKRMYADQADLVKILEDISLRFSPPLALPLEIALSKSLLGWNEQTQWAEHLRSLDSATIDQRLGATATLVWKNPSQRTRLVSEVAETTQEASLADRMRAVSWLLQEKAAHAGSSLIHPDETATSLAVLTLWSEVQLESGKEDTVQKLLDNPAAPVPLRLNTLLEARILKRRGDGVGSAALFMTAYQRSKNNPDALSELALILAKEDQRDLLKTLFTERVKPALDMTWLEALVSKSRTTRDSTVTLRILEAAGASSHLKSATLDSEREYLRIVLGKSPTPDFLEGLARRHPKDPSVFIPYLAFLIASNRAPDALQALRSSPVDLNARLLPARFQAVLAWVFAKNNRSADALRLASLIPPHSLSVQEELVLSNFLGPSALPPPSGHRKP